MFYIGVHSSDNLENNYRGSVRNKKWGNQWEDISSRCQKVILAVWDSREEAISHEILLHEIFNVAANPKFFNQAKQTSTKFDTTGVKFPGVKSGSIPWNKGKKTGPLSEETKIKMSKMRKGVPKSEKTKQAIRSALKGRRPSQQCLEAVKISNKNRYKINSV